MGLTFEVARVESLSDNGILNVMFFHQHVPTAQRHLCFELMIHSDLHWHPADAAASHITCRSLPIILNPLLKNIELQWHEQNSFRTETSISVTPERSITTPSQFLNISAKSISNPLTLELLTNPVKQRVIEPTSSLVVSASTGTLIIMLRLIY